MSVPEPTVFDDRATESLPALQDVLATTARLAVRPVRFVAFWVATLLPLLYVPLLVTGTVATNRLGFVGLLGLNAVAFVVGHAHNSPE
jgi:hypothetical protein